MNTLPTIIAEGRETLAEGKWYYCYENGGAMRGIPGKEMIMLMAEFDRYTTTLLSAVAETAEGMKQVIVPTKTGASPSNWRSITGGNAALAALAASLREIITSVVE